MNKTNALEKIQIAITGCGAHAVKHAEAIAVCAELKIVACCDVLPERAREWGRQHNCTPSDIKTYNCCIHRKTKFNNKN